jgi:hypothetical protein
LAEIQMIKSSYHNIRLKRRNLTLIDPITIDPQSVFALPLFCARQSIVLII